MSGVRRFLLPSMAPTEDTFARLVSLAVHDLRTPLATVSGFARTLQRTPLGDPADKYVQMMVAASNQLAELLEDIGLVARIESGRWEPNVQEVDSLELASNVAGAVEGAHAEGSGAPVRVDRDGAETALRHLARCALRHGGLQKLDLTVAGPELAIAPVTDGAAPILLGQEARDLGALIALRIVRALGGSVELDGGRLLVRLPA
jgi:signal transduction histidine kinase